MIFIETRAEQQFLERTLGRLRFYGQFWIGVEKDQDGSQVWMDGTSITYNNFGTPINDGGECFRLSYAFSYLWHDTVCSYRYSFICERDIGECDGLINNV